ncbi:TPA: DUF551 domain-containing protein [Klebsiella quasipneumoniae subsp. quasipneumoniae]|nr:DUF551 domain-containing protein [Klebsiella quasipneumoniae subsp. quasipneumoniae]
MSEFSRETLLNIIETDHVQCGEASALARMALVAMGSEPVAYIDKQWTLVYYVPPMSMGLKIGDKLYRHAQPAPVVMDGYVMVPKEMTDEIGEAIAMQANCCGGIALDIYDAMLAAAPQSPGSEPATVPGKWIPVSERMPEDRTQVILWDAEIGEVTSGHYSHKTHTFYHCGDAIENEITHWMAPPAAPQEVSDA